MSVTSKKKLKQAFIILIFAGTSVGDLKKTLPTTTITVPTTVLTLPTTTPTTVTAQITRGKSRPVTEKRLKQETINEACRF